MSVKTGEDHRSYDVLKIALFHTLGDLPEPELTHSFC